MAKSKDLKKHSEVVENEGDIRGNVISSEEEQSKDLIKQLEEEKKQVYEYKNMYLRALADYKNLENRTQLERERMRMMIQRQCVEHFLPVVDNLDQAEIFMSDPGLKMISSSFRQALKEMGVQEVELLGNEYDPHYSEVVEVVEGKQDNIIVEVLQKAYEMNGEVIRPGKVKVSKITSTKL